MPTIPTYGVRPYGVGTPAVAQASTGYVAVDPYTGVLQGSRRLDPATRDYTFGSVGRIQGMTNAQQLVYLAVKTEKGTSAMRALGQELRQVDRITSNMARRVDDILRAAVQHIVDFGLIEVVGTRVEVVRPGVAKARLLWRDLDTDQVEQTETTL